MQTSLVAAAGTALMLSAAPAAAQLEAMGGGGEIRRNADFGGESRYEVLKLSSNGTFSGNYESRRPGIRGVDVVRMGNVSGRWSLQGNTLCFEGTGLVNPGRNCYALTKGGFSARQYAGSHTQTGQVWQFFLYPQSR